MNTDRFKQLLESSLGNVKPLISEQEVQMTDDNIDAEIENMDENDGDKLEKFLYKLGHKIKTYRGKQLRKLRKMLNIHSNRPRVRQSALECPKF